MQSLFQGKNEAFRPFIAGINVIFTFRFGLYSSRKLASLKIEWAHCGCCVLMCCKAKCLRRIVVSWNWTFTIPVRLSVWLAKLHLLNYLRNWNYSNYESDTILNVIEYFDREFNSNVVSGVLWTKRDKTWLWNDNENDVNSNWICHSPKSSWVEIKFFMLECSGLLL